MSDTAGDSLAPTADEVLHTTLDMPFDDAVPFVQIEHEHADVETVRVTRLDRMIEGGVLEPDDERVAAARERTERLVEQARDRAAAEGRTVDTAIETGDPADAILEYVDDHDVDHVVMGGHGGEAGSIARRLLGTVATAVVGGADVTVTVVRHDD